MAWVIFILAIAFYFYEFFIRVSPSVMVPELMKAFGVNATAVGTLSGFYFYIYAPMQLPVGVLTDRFGARKLLALAAFGAGLGMLLFSVSDFYWLAAVGRFLMGAASSFGFVGMVYICSHWFPSDKRGMLIGVGNAIGMLGAVVGQGPLSQGIQVFGWRYTLFTLAILGFLLGILIFFLVRNDPPGIKTPKPKKESLWKNILIVTKNPYSWINAFIGFCIYVTTTAFAGLWGIPYLVSNYGISTHLAGYCISMVFIGWAVGGPLIGFLSDRIGEKKTLLLISSFLGAVLMGLLILIPNLPIFLLFTLLFFVGFVSSGQLLNFGYSIDINPEFAKGTATAFTNFMIMAGGAIAQPFIGFLLDYNWGGEIANGVHIYSPETYKIAMLFFPLSFVVAFVLGLFLKKIKKTPKSKKPRYKYKT